MTAQELKNSILQLAVQGKLVPQCKEDEPASELLKRIRAEKAKFIKEGRIKGRKTLLPIKEDKVEFDIPSNWQWVLIGDIFTVIMGQSPDGKTISTNAIGMEFHQGKIYFSDTVISKSPQTTSAPTKIAPANSVLLCVRAPVGKLNITDRDICIGRGLCSVVCHAGVSSKFAYYWLQSLENQFNKKATGSTFKAISNEIIQTQSIPLPPLAEQKRIVAKIEELMPLVEEYGKAEEQLTKLNTEFPDKLRKSILQQAVQGKLTERDPADEPASELLKRIKTEKETLLKSGKIKKEKPLPEITEDDKPFDIPDTWEWIRLGDIVRYQGGYAYKSDTYVGCSNNQIIRLGNVKNNKLLLDSAPVFVSDHIACETEEYRIMPNTILFTMTGTKGKRDYFYTCCTTENNMGSNSLYLNQRVGCLKADGDICLDWLVIFLQSETVLSQIFATATGNVNQSNIGSNSTLNLVLPLPPLAEQKRIVKRVEELLALCDELK